MALSWTHIYVITLGGCLDTTELQKWQLWRQRKIKCRKQPPCNHWCTRECACVSKPVIVMITLMTKPQWISMDFAFVSRIWGQWVSIIYCWQFCDQWSLHYVDQGPSRHISLHWKISVVYRHPPMQGGDINVRPGQSHVSIGAPSCLSPGTCLNLC